MSTSPARPWTARHWQSWRKSPGARGVFLRRIVRGATATDIPILPNTKIQRGDILTIVGRQQDIAAGDQDCWAFPIVPPTSRTSPSSAVR